MRAQLGKSWSFLVPYMPLAAQIGLKPKLGVLARRTSL